MAKQTIGEFMALLRKANGYTQAEVAEKLNISNRTLSSWETDRTLPDALVLPAIADLYNVTVDELLRGEKATEKTANVISDASLKNVSKQRFGRFNVKIRLLGGIAILCEAVIILACVLSLYTSAPLWLVILLGVIGGIGAGVCAILACYFANSLKLSEGITSAEDYSNDNKALLLAVKRRLSDFFGICAAAFALSFAALLIAFIVINPQDYTVLNVTVNVREAHIAVICVNAFLCVALFVAFLCTRFVGFKKVATETQYTVYKSNKRFLGKVAAFGCIPLAVVLILNITIACVFPGGKRTLYQCDDWLAFKTHLSAIVVDEHEADNFGIAAEEYYLSFPIQPELGTEYDFGNGFYGYWHGDYIEFVNGRYKPVANWEVRHNSKYGYTVWNLYAYVFDDDTSDHEYVVNARYHQDDHLYDRNDNLIGELTITQKNNMYRLEQDVSQELERTGLYTWTLIPLTTAIVCCVVYLAKRKKQKYSM